MSYNTSCKSCSRNHNTSYHVNIIHHESHVSSDNNKQYNTMHMPMSYSTPKPRRWQSDLRGTDANSGDGWVGSLVDGLAFPELVQKSARSIGVRTACSNTDAGPAVPAVAALPRYTNGSRWYTCAAAAPHSARSRWLKPKNKSEPESL